MNKGLKWALISLPILIGGFIVYRTLRPKAPKPTEPGRGGGTLSPGGGGTPSGGGGGYTPPPSPKPDFPIGLGSKGAKVKELQQAIVDDGQANIVSLLGANPTDGKFGTGTEKAVKALLGKTKIDSQADIDNIKKLKAQRIANQTAAQTATQGDANREIFGKVILAKMPTGLTTLETGNHITKTTYDSAKQRKVSEERIGFKKGEIARPWGNRPLVQEKFVANKNTPILPVGTVVMWVTEGGKNVRYHFNPYFFAIV